jgi:uracil-DNA glycosylase
MYLATTKAQLNVLNEDIINCRACPRLVAWREQVATERRAAYRDQEYWGRPLPGFGDPAAQLLVVGLAPAAHGGNRTGRFFTGDRSGDWLYEAMWKAGFASQPTSRYDGDGLTLSGAYVTAAVRCAPPANKPSVEERDTCEPYLRREWELLSDVRVVVPLGSYAFGSVVRLAGLRPRPAFGHGVEVALPGGRTVVCSYHPSQQNTFTGKLTHEMLAGVFHRARAIIERGP